ncbi:MAG TPA: hypothetical protein VFQ01_04810 [Nocardioides sp.]|jgi:UDP-N-acetylglucosamine:LPS N-acetylglucosamine transferase|nr:hypothetical protein [Nocardioides sp.]
MARILLLSASMGSGHDAVAFELAKQCAGRDHETQVVDVLALCPWGTGRMLRAFYQGMLRHAPWLYEAIYRLFFDPCGGPKASVSPAVWLALPGTRRAVRSFHPDVVVSTFHLAGQVVGRLREGGQAVPSVVVITDAVGHRVWHAHGTDLYLCSYPWVAEQVRGSWGAEALATGPIVDAAFQRAAQRAPEQMTGAGVIAPADRAGRTPVLVSTGSWGVGDPARVARILHDTNRYVAVVLCGRNRKLCRRLMRRGDCIPLGWTSDVAGLMVQCRALVENGGGGATCVEAFAAGLPVTEFDPIPGHGRAGAEALVKAGLIQYASDPAELIRCLDEVCDRRSPLRRTMIEAARTLTRYNAAEVLLEWRDEYAARSTSPYADREISA